MKKLLLTAFSFVAISASFAQTSQLHIQNAPATVYGSYTQTAPLVATFQVMNMGTQAVDVKVARKITSEVAGSENNFCWGVNCYPPFVSVSPDAQTIAAGATNSSFVGDYTPNGFPGVTIIRYSFFKTTGSPDSVHTTIRFDATSNISGTRKDVGNNDMLSLPSPNPANEMTMIQYNLPASARNAKLRVLNVIGAVVKEMNLEKQGAAVILTSGLPNGVYFYNLQIDGRSVSTKKLIVKH